MRIWTLDKGNTRTKVIVFERLARRDSGNIVEIRTPQGEVECFRWEQVDNISGEPVVYSDVTYTQHPAGWLGLRVDNPALQIEYSTKESLGTDRIAAAISVSSEYSDRTLIVDAGTFTTCDIVEKGIFYGGAIMPGLDGLVEISEKAEGLRGYARSAANSVRKGCRGIYPGDSTLNCLINGYYRQTVKAIHDMAKDVKNIVFTGGDGLYLSRHFDAPYDPILVNKGLLLFYLQTGER